MSSGQPPGGTQSGSQTAPRKLPLGSYNTHPPPPTGLFQLPLPSRAGISRSRSPAGPSARVNGDGTVLARARSSPATGSVWSEATVAATAEPYGKSNIPVRSPSSSETLSAWSDAPAAGTRNIRNRRASTLDASRFTDDGDTPSLATRGRTDTQGLTSTLRSPDRSSTVGEKHVVKGVAKHVLPSHYQYAPTVPSPFEPSLEASLDTLLHFQQIFPPLTPLITPLIEPPNRSTSWPILLKIFLSSGDPNSSHALRKSMAVDLLFLITRQLLPNQIAANRGFLNRLYQDKKSVSVRLLLRYDMLRGQTPTGANMDTKARQVHVESSVPKPPGTNQAEIPTPIREPDRPGRPELLPNVIKTLIAAPQQGYGSIETGKKMRHNVTSMDDMLLLQGVEVEAYSDTRFLFKFADVVLLWQELRLHNEILEDMEVDMWDSLDEPIDSNEWVMDVGARLTKKEKQEGFAGVTDKPNRRRHR